MQTAPGEVQLSWQPVSGVSFYGLFGPGLTAGGEKVSGATTFTATNVPGGTQQWSLGSFYAGNVSTPASAFPTVTLNVIPVPVNPSGFSAVQTGPGQVQLSWQPVSGASYYVLLGPGVTAGGEKVSGATTFTATNVPAGLSEWAIASFYDPGPVSTAAAAFPRVTLNVVAPAPAAPAPAATSGRYRVVADRFRVVRQTFDDILDADGKGDEVYGAFAMFHMDRAKGLVLDQDLRRTQVLGQNLPPLNHLRAGSASPVGGLQSGDTYPGASANPAFPLVIWDGFLTDAQDAMVILPTIWESDNDVAAYDDWFIREMAAAPLFWWDTGVQAAVSGQGQKQGIPLVAPAWIPPGPYGMKHDATDNFMTTFGFTGLGPIIPRDRPVGLSLRSSGFELPRRAIVLTRELIEKALAPPSAADAAARAADIKKMQDLMRQQQQLIGQAASFAVAPGDSHAMEEIETLSAQLRPDSITIPLIDGPAPNLNGNYILYLHVERVP